MQLSCKKSFRFKIRKYIYNHIKQKQLEFNLLKKEE